MVRNFRRSGQEPDLSLMSQGEDAYLVLRGVFHVSPPALGGLSIDGKHAYSDAVVLIGQSLADPNMRRWLAWSASVRAAESSRRAKRTIEVLPHFWFKRRPKDAQERVFFENALTHLGVRIVWLDSWGQTADVMRNLLAITPPS